ncbi:hypothetical protein [Plectonema phage JingP1]|uniref:Uncharacterized protein n=1 Tax=Plectonema phage JingP1 TaxID=2961687 RepID=A0A9E7T1F0_9CAUD|nr:hypothetical protein [Plectonema phage JingP1]
MTTTFTVTKSTHNHTRFTVTRQRDGKAPDTLSVSYGAKTGGMSIKANGVQVKGSLAKSTLWQAVHGAVCDYLTANDVAIGSPTVKAPKATATKAEKPAYKSIPYRTLQAELRAYREHGGKVSVPLNSKAEVLYDEYMRLGLGGKSAGTVHYLNVKPMLGGKENCNGTAPTYKGYTDEAMAEYEAA